MIGKKISHYTVTAKLGAGGMGEVYRAHDDRLGRDVALKIIPPNFAEDPERMARFRREAQLLASLNHPNIGSIYGLEESGGVHCLVLELIEGNNLDERIKSGQLTLEEVLSIAAQIAQAIEAAHEKGIIHRDLKPANVKVTPEGAVKVLDFGLAKALEGEASAHDLSKSPAITHVRGDGGIVLGTAAYVSPEQARGEPLDDSTELMGLDRSPTQRPTTPVDKRTDIWAFGCILFEALAGRKAFDGVTVSDSIAKILTRDPDWGLLPPSTPPQIRLLLQRCLQKNRRRRLHDIADARIEIEDLLAQSSSSSAAAIPLAALQPKRRGQGLSWYVVGGVAALAALITGGLVWKALSGRQAAPRHPVRFVVPVAPNEVRVESSGSAVAVSPNGTRLVFVGGTGMASQLYVRPLDTLEAEPLPGTERASAPFFSPDGEWVGFFADGTLKKVSLAGGPPVTLCDAPDGRGASWGADDAIIFAPTPLSGLSRVSAAGGTPEVLTAPDEANNERTHRWPRLLPGGDSVLFTINYQGSSNFGEASIAALSLRTGKWRVLVEHGSDAHYAPSGHLVYARAGALHAVPFDVNRLDLLGSAVPVLEDVAMHSGTGGAHFSLSEDGSLVFIPGAAADPGGTLVLVNRRGEESPLTEGRREYLTPRLSPDGLRMTLSIQEATGFDVWIYDLHSGALTPLVSGESFDASPLWTPDGQRVTFTSTRLGGQPNLFWTRADGSGGEERLTVSGNVQFPDSWSPDGRFLAFTEETPSTGRDIWVVDVKGDRVPQPVLRTRANEQHARFSPDGRWLAYASDESGRWEVYVQPFPGPGGKVRISLAGGQDPVWEPEGKELFYRNQSKFMVAETRASPSFSAANHQVLFERLFQVRPGFVNFDVTPDGQHLVLITERQPLTSATQLSVVLNWFEELSRRAATNED